MKKTHFFLMALASLMAAVAINSCDKKNGEEEQETTVTPELTLNTASVAAFNAAANYAVTVTCNTAWTAAVSNNATWCTVSPKTATGNGTLTVSVTENTTSERTATVTISAGTLTKTIAVTQLATPPTLTLSVDAIAATADESSYKFTVASNIAWTATVNSAATWCTLTDAVSSGVGYVTVNVEANPTITERSATLTVTTGTLTKTVTVTQDAGAPALSVSPSTISVPIEASSYTVAVTSNTAWVATSNATWCTLADASATGNGTLTVHVAANTFTSTRTATITVSAGTLSQTITVQQAPLVLYTDKTIIEATVAANSYTIAITSNTTWTATSNAAWCTVSPATATGNGTINVTTSTSTIDAARFATVTISSGSIKIIVEICTIVTGEFVSELGLWITTQKYDLYVLNEEYRTDRCYRLGFGWRTPTENEACRLLIYAAANAIELPVRVGTNSYATYNTFCGYGTHPYSESLGLACEKSNSCNGNEYVKCVR